MNTLFIISAGNNTKSCILIILFFFCSIFSLDRAKFNSNIAFLDEGVMVPFYSGFISIPVHPGLMLGCEYYYKELKNLTLLQSFNAGFYYHRNFEHGIFGCSEFGFRPIFNFGIAADILLGIGYLHTFEDGPIFSQNSAGEFVQIRNFGRPHLMGTLSLGLGYDFSKKTRLSILPYIRYQAAIEYPYTLHNGDIPVLIHTIFYIGTIFDMNGFFSSKNRR